VGKPAPDLTGHVFGRLTVVEHGGYEINGMPLWVCRCTCGDTVRTRGQNLVRGVTRSCGCLRAESARTRIAELNRQRRGDR